MSRKFVGICVALYGVIFVALAGQKGSAAECGEEKATECKEMLLSILFGDTSEEEACEKLYGVSKCLRNVVDECLGDENNPEVEKSLKDFNDFLDDNCPATPEGDEGGEDEVKQCLDKNQDYFLECIFDRETGDISQLMQPDLDSIDPNFIQCHLYSVMAHCVVERSEEKCGVEGGKRAEELLSDPPASVRESCDSQQNSLEDSVQEFFSVDLLDQRKKRDVDYRKKRQLEYRKKRNAQMLFYFK